MNSPNPWSGSVTKPHVTLLDEAEVGSIAGSKVITSTLAASVTVGGPDALLVGAAAAAANWKSAIPKEARWVDNYISAVGIQHEAAVNVCLLKAAETTPDVFAAHRYAHEWYRHSVVPLSCISTATDGVQSVL